MTLDTGTAGTPATTGGTADRPAGDAHRPDPARGESREERTRKRRWGGRRKRPGGRARADRRGRSAAPRRWARMRRAMVPYHRWIGLVGAIPLILLSLTGGILVFRPEIDRLLNGGAFGRGGDVPATAEGIPAAADAVARVSGDRVTRVYAQGGDYIVTAASDDGASRRWVVDAVSGEPAGPLEEGVVGFLANVHTCGLTCSERPGYAAWLAVELGPASLGTWLLALGAITAILLAVTGAWTWWRVTPRLRDSLRVRRWRPAARRDRELHIALGAAACVPLLIWGITGAVWEVPGGKEAYSAITGATSKGHGGHGGGEPDAGPDIGMAAAIDAGAEAIPGAEVTGVGAPTPKRPGYTIYLQEGDLDLWAHGDGYHANRRVAVDAATGQARITRGGDAGWADKLRDQWFGPIHYGWWAPWYVKVVWAFLGFTPAVLSVTGVAIWWRRRRAARLRARRAGAAG